METTRERNHRRALHVITKYADRCKISASGFALLVEGLDNAEAHGLTDAAIREEFTDPLASRIIDAINAEMAKGKGN